MTFTGHKNIVRGLYCILSHTHKLGVIWVFFGLIWVMIWQKPCNNLFIRYSFLRTLMFSLNYDYFSLASTISTLSSPYYHSKFPYHPSEKKRIQKDNDQICDTYKLLSIFLYFHCVSNCYASECPIMILMIS